MRKRYSALLDMTTPEFYMPGIMPGAISFPEPPLPLSSGTGKRRPLGRCVWARHFIGHQQSVRSSTGSWETIILFPDFQYSRSRWMCKLWVRSPRARTWSTKQSSLRHINQQHVRRCCNFSLVSNHNDLFGAYLRARTFRVLYCEGNRV